ncbi:ATP-grasp domain-containing protein [Bacteroides fragilis]|nr:ATP-grasp domain-containing protein [Bacteroides fragilis]
MQYPLVVKPDAGAGSIGVRTVSDSSQACEVVENITNTLEFFGAQPACAIAQEYVQGHEYIVDTFAQQGQHHVMAVCVYRKHPSSTGAIVYDSLE